MRRLTATLAAVTIWASPAAADDWLQPVVNLQQSLAALGIGLGGGVTSFGQGMAAGDGSNGIPLGGKTDVLLGLDGSKLGLWSGLSMSAHFEQGFGQSANERSDGAILPVNTALGFPKLGGTTTDLSLIVSQKIGDAVTISLGKFNMLDVAARTPLMGGGGETTFWNIGFAAPVSGVTPPYIVGGIATVKTAPATFTLMVYDPRNAQDLSVIEHPFSQGTTTSLSAMVPITLFGLTGYHTLRAVYSTADGFNFDAVPQLFLPSGSQMSLTKRGYYFASYSLQQFVWQDPANPGRGWGFFHADLGFGCKSQSDRKYRHPRSGRLDSWPSGRSLGHRMVRLPVQPSAQERARRAWRSVERRARARGLLRRCHRPSCTSGAGRAGRLARNTGRIDSAVPRLAGSSGVVTETESMEATLPWIYLTFAGLMEIGWPVALKIAQTQGHRLIGVVVALAFMLASGFLLWLAQKDIPIGTSYAVWTGIGAAGTFLFGILFYGGAAGATRFVGVGLILLGVATLKLTHG